MIILTIFRSIDITAFKSVAVGSVFVLVALGVSACGEGGSKPATASSSKTQTKAASKGSGTITTAAGKYRFSPTTCAMAVEDGAHDIEVAGAGIGPDDAPIYVEFTSTGNALDIGLGVDRKFATAERRLVGGRFTSKPFDIAVSGTVIRASGIVLKNDSGEPFDDDASFEIDCG